MPCSTPRSNFIGALCTLADCHYGPLNKRGTPSGFECVGHVRASATRRRTRSRRVAGLPALDSYYDGDSHRRQLTKFDVSHLSADNSRPTRSSLTASKLP